MVVVVDQQLARLIYAHVIQDTLELTAKIVMKNPIFLKDLTSNNYFFYQVNPCFTSQCFNGATCQPTGSSFICLCPQFYTGTNCQTCNSKALQSTNLIDQINLCILIQIQTRAQIVPA